jgi:uroporphyrin-III C-methyltransferase
VLWWRSFVKTLCWHLFDLAPFGLERFGLEPFRDTFLHTPYALLDSSNRLRLNTEMDADFSNTTEPNVGTASAATQRRGAGAPVPVLAWVALAVGALALVFGIGLWFELRGEQRELTQTLGTKMAELDKASRDLIGRNEALQRDLRDAQNRVALLEAKLGEFQSQRSALEEMTRELARAPEDWLLAEIEQTLAIASRELVLAGNVRAAITALQNADQRLARADTIQTTALRRALATDLERLKATPSVDSQGVAVKIDNLIALANTLPLAVPASMKDIEATRASASAQAEPNTAWYTIAWRDFLREMRDLIRIRELDAQEAALITPQQASLVRENLKLRLLAARTSLIARDETNFKEDVRNARDLVAKYFDPKAKVNQNALITLKLLMDNPVSIATPDIVTSQNAVRAARVARERPVVR